MPAVLYLTQPTERGLHSAARQSLRSQIAGEQVLNCGGQLKIGELLHSKSVEQDTPEVLPMTRRITEKSRMSCIVVDDVQCIKVCTTDHLIEGTHDVPDCLSSGRGIDDI